VISLRKKDVFSIITNSTRHVITKRLGEAGKAAYSDILDSVDFIHPLNSTGNFNYHLNFLIRTDMVTRDGSVYRLSDDGKKILKFVEDVNQMWQELQRNLRGVSMNVISQAEHFEEEMGVKMEKEVMDFKGLDMIMDEKRIIGIVGLGDSTENFSSYETLELHDFKVTRKSYKTEKGVIKEVILLTHPEIKYELSPRWFGTVQEYLERNYGNTFVYALKKNPAPFLIRSESIGKGPSSCSFVIAPSVFNTKLREEVPDKTDCN
jgi:hypothetical protein